VRSPLASAGLAIFAGGKPAIIGIADWLWEGLAVVIRDLAYAIMLLSPIGASAPQFFRENENWRIPPPVVLLGLGNSDSEIRPRKRKGLYRKGRRFVGQKRGQPIPATPGMEDPRDVLRRQEAVRLMEINYFERAYGLVRRIHFWPCRPVRIGALYKQNLGQATGKNGAFFFCRPMAHAAYSVFLRGLPLYFPDRTRGAWGPMIGKISACPRLWEKGNDPPAMKGAAISNR